MKSTTCKISSARLKPRSETVKKTTDTIAKAVDNVAKANKPEAPKKPEKKRSWFYRLNDWFWA